MKWRWKWILDKSIIILNKKKLKPRLCPDLKWDSSDKIDQYKCIQKIFQVYFKLERAKHDPEFKEKKTVAGCTRPKNQRKTIPFEWFENEWIPNGWELVKRTLSTSECTKTARNFGQNFERLRLFDKRKMLDRLRHKEEQLCKTFLPFGRNARSREIYFYV